MSVQEVGYFLDSLLIAAKTADQSVSGNTMVSDTELFLPLEASARYRGSVIYSYTSAAQAVDMTMTVPSGAGGFFMEGAGTEIGVVKIAFGTQGRTNQSETAMSLNFVISTSTTAGNIQFQYGLQSTDLSNPVTVEENSIIIAWRVR